MPVINIPPQTTIERNAFVDPSDGSTIINTDIGNLQFTLDNGVSWNSAANLTDVTFQNSYNNSNSFCLGNDPFEIMGEVLSVQDINSYVNSSGSAINPGSDRIQGMKFTASQAPGEIMKVTHLQYLDANFNIANGPTRAVGIYDVTTETLLGSVLVEKTDPLDGAFRTKALSTPVDLTIGEDYVVVTVVPAGETYFVGTATGVASQVGSAVAANGPNSSVLVYPAFILTNPNQISGGGFQFDILIEEEIFSVDNDKSQAINSTSLMLDTVATLSDLQKSYGEMCFEGNSTPTVITAVNTPVKVVGLYMSGILTDFTHSNGTLTYVGSKQKDFCIICNNTSILPTGASANKYTMYIYVNGNPVPTKQANSPLALQFPASLSLSTLISLNPSDNVEVFVENNVDVDNYTVENLNCIPFQVS